MWGYTVLSLHLPSAEGKAGRSWVVGSEGFASLYPRTPRVSRCLRTIDQHGLARSPVLLDPISGHCLGHCCPICFLAKPP